MSALSPEQHARMNSATPEERAQALDRGMRLIYGGDAASRDEVAGLRAESALFRTRLAYLRAAIYQLQFRERASLLKPTYPAPDVHTWCQEALRISFDGTTADHLPER